jgi:hypothetical protein
LAPPLAQLSGDAFVRALVDLGWIVLDRTETECRVTLEGRIVTVPREHRLSPRLVANLSIAAGIGPMTLISAIERTLTEGVDPKTRR